MCGIAGFFDRDLTAPRAEQILRAMGQALARRGPDGEGTWFDREHGLGLSHRRLAILDLSESGHQPMNSADGRWIISFNGEIYNHDALKTELVHLGHAFRGHSDTEVLVNGFANWGFKAVIERVRGMFAIAAYDRSTGTLWLARDPAGEKPLYYTLQDDRFIFASTTAALEAVPGFKADIDPDAVAALVQRGFIPAPLSIYRGVRKLHPGYLLECELSAPTPRVAEHCYWSLGESASTMSEGATEAELLEELHEQLLVVVGEQMIADRPLGTFLSGGVDSSLVTALMQANASRPVRTFTIGFREKDFDEAEHARAIATHLGTEHTEVYLEPDAGLAYIENLPEAFDEPFADPSQLPTLLISEVARRDVVVCLSGDGGDESFAGYSRYLQNDRRWRQLSRWPMPFRGAAGNALKSFGRDGIDRWAAPMLGMLGLRDTKRSTASALRFWGEYWQTPDLSTLYARAMSSWYDADQAVPGARLKKTMTDFLAPVGREHREETAIRQMMHWDFGSYLPDDVLVKVDRASMFHSLEVRAPLLDRRVVEAAWRLPAGLLTADGRGKYPLRRLLARHVPVALFDRPKQGFGVPLVRWLRGPLSTWAENLLNEDRLAATGLFDPGVIRLRWRQHLDGVWDNSTTLWPVLMFMAWWERRGGTVAEDF